MYSGEGTEALFTAGAATYCSEVEGAGAGAGACRGSLVQSRLLKATPSTGATCKNMPISEGTAGHPLAGAEPDRLTRKDGEDMFVLKWQLSHMELKQSIGSLLPSPAPQHLVKRPWAFICSVSCICRLSHQMTILNAQRLALYCAFGTGMVDFDPRKEISVQLKGLTVSLTPKPCSCTLGGSSAKTCTPGVYTFCGLSMVSLAVKFQPNRQLSMVACTQHYQH